MGCISSKALCRSISYRDELNQNSQKTAKSIPAIEEILFSDKGSDQFLTLVCTANTVANGLRSGRSISLESKSGAETTNGSTGDGVAKSSLESIKDAKKDKEEMEEQSILPWLLQPPGDEDVKSNQIEPLKRSKSWHNLLEESETGVNNESSNISSNDFESMNKGVGRCRSFHTVEEFDALLERIKMGEASFSHKELSDDGNSVYTRIPKSHNYSQYEAFHVQEDSLEVQEMNFQHQKEKDELSIQQSNTKNETENMDSASILTSRSETKAEISSLVNLSLSERSNIIEDPAQEKHVIRKESKRQAVAKGLDSLVVPTAVELQAVASLREWLHGGGQVFSPGTYVTPRFGSYSFPAFKSQHEHKDENIFDTQFVTAFEEHMQKLEAEEEALLKQIEENWEHDRMKENQLKDKTISR